MATTTQTLQKRETADSESSSTSSTEASTQAVQLKQSLRGMDYQRAAAALSPTGVVHGPSAPVVQREQGEGEEDANVVELQTKVAALVQREHGGDYGAAFDHYAGRDGQADRSEVDQLLRDADVGNRLTRRFWINGILERFDTDGSGTISRAEFLTVLN